MSYSMDRYGYYQIGDYKTYSFYELMDRYKEDPQPYKWVYNDDFFSQYDWSYEPTESIDELYKQRAIELREQYDYIVLQYSGGYDSANMLRAFVDNGIYPDELLIYYSRHDTVSNQYHELKNYTWKKIEKIEKEYPQIKIRKIDYSDMICNWQKIIDRFITVKRYIDCFGTHLTVNRLILDVLPHYVDEWKQLSSSNKKVTIIAGYEKTEPYYNYIEQLLYFSFNDSSLQYFISPFKQMINDDLGVISELFYWGVTDVCAKIMIKQCHLIKSTVDFDQLDLLLSQKNQKTDYWLKELNLSKTIYPTQSLTNEEFYDPTKKEPNPLWGNRDQWFFNSKHLGSREHDIMYRSMFLSHNKHWREWGIDKKYIGYGFKKIQSPKYVIFKK